MNASTIAMLTSSIAAARDLTALTHCCDCGRGLNDPTSVELGIGPICRKHGAYNDSMCVIAEALRPLAKATIKAIAFAQKGAELIAHCDVLRSLGFDKLADRVELRLADVVVTETDVPFFARLEVTFNYNPDAYYAFKRIAGSELCPKVKGGPVFSFPLEARGAICTVLKSHYAGKLVFGRNGLAVVESGWKRNSMLDLDTLNAMAAALRKTGNEACVERADAVTKLADGTAHKDTQGDWLPEVPMPESYYAM